MPSRAGLVNQDNGVGNNRIACRNSNDTIMYNVSDGGLAHAITSGIGKDKYYG